MKKKLLILLLILCTGCGAKYTMTINNDTVNEAISLDIYDNEIIYDDLAPDLEIKSSESINSLINSELYAIDGNKNSAYKKDVTTENGLTHVELEYDYDIEDFVNSSVMNKCFSNANINVTDKLIDISLEGEFLCLVDDTDSVEFKLVTPNKIKSADFEYSMFNDEYTWTFNKSNSKNVNIHATIYRETKLHYYGLRMIPIAILVVLLIFAGYFGYRLYVGIKKNNEI